MPNHLSNTLMIASGVCAVLALGVMLRANLKYRSTIPHSRFKAIRLKTSLLLALTFFFMCSGIFAVGGVSDDPGMLFIMATWLAICPLGVGIIYFATLTFEERNSLPPWLSGEE